MEEHCKAVQSKADATSRCAKEQPPPPLAPRSSAPKGQNLKAPPKGQNLNVWVHKKWTDTSDPHQVAMRQLKDKKNRREAYRKARRAGESAAAQKAASSTTRSASEWFGPWKSEQHKTTSEWLGPWTVEQRSECECQ